MKFFIATHSHTHPHSLTLYTHTFSICYQLKRRRRHYQYLLLNNLARLPVTIGVINIFQSCLIFISFASYLNIATRISASCGAQMIQNWKCISKHQHCSAIYLCWKRERERGKREKKNFVDLHLSLNNKWPNGQNGKVACGMWHVVDGGMWHAAYAACDMGHRSIKCTVSTFTRASLIYLINSSRYKLLKL